MAKYKNEILEKEKEKLYALIDDAKGHGITISEAQAILKQSEKIDSLIQKLQKSSKPTVEL